MPIPQRLLTRVRKAYPSGSRYNAAISDQEKKKLLEELQKHMAAEKEMCENYQKFLSQTTDPRTKNVLKHIISDEVRHNRVLKEFHENLLMQEHVIDILSYEWIKRL